MLCEICEGQERAEPGAVDATAVLVNLGDAGDPRQIGLQSASTQAFEIEETNETGY